MKNEGGCMFYIKPSCKSFAETDVADIAGVAQTAAYIHVFFEQVARLNDKPTQAVVQMAKSSPTETIHTINI
jgi:hypothetical protein